MMLQKNKRTLSRTFASGFLAVALAAVSAPLLAQNLTISANAQTALSLAEELYPALFTNGTELRSYQGYTYKYYAASGIYVGFKDGKIFLMGGQFGTGITEHGTEAAVVSQLQTLKTSRDAAGATATVSGVKTLSAAAGGRTENSGIFLPVGNGYQGFYTDVSDLKSALFTADDVRGSTVDVIPSESALLTRPTNIVSDTVKLADGSGHILALQSTGFQFFGTAQQAYRFLKIDASGNAVGTPTEIVRGADLQATSVRVEQLSDGGLVFVWNEQVFVPATGIDSRIGARVYNADLTPRTAVLNLIDHSGAVVMTDIAATAGGGFTVGFIDRTTNAAGDLSLLSFTASGAESGTQKKGIDTFTMDGFAKLADGNFVIAQLSSGGFFTRTSTLSIQIVNGEGLPVVAESTYETLTVAASGGNEHSQPVVVPLPEGGFFLVWAYTPASSSQQGDIYAQQFSATGTAVGGKIQVDAGTVGLQQLHKVTVLNGKRIAVSWNNATPSPIEYDALYAILTYK